MRILIAVLFLFLSAVLFGTEPAMLSGEIEFRMVPGPEYSRVMKFGPMTINLMPQIAVWICSPDGKYRDTLYVTGKAAKGKWGGGINQRRPDALPAWSHARGVESAKGYFMPEGKTALPDAVSGATSAGELVFRWKIPLETPVWKYPFRAEVNCSFDYNGRFAQKLPKNSPDYSGVNGQPSLVYEAILDLPKNTNAAVLKLIGAGSLRGEDGGIGTNVAGIDTATNIVKTMTVRFIPAER